MDTDVWKIIRNAVRSVDRSVARRGRRKTYSDQLVVKMYFWSVMHDRPRNYATRRTNYTSLFRPRMLPSYSQFCRRLHACRVIEMIACVNRRLSQTGGSVQLAFMDGKALPISESSKDPDARTGRGQGKFSRGYKIHTLALQNGRIHAFCVRPMNEAEPRVSREQLVQHVPARLTVLADGNYDSKFLYDAIAERGSCFLAPPKKAPQQRRSWKRTSAARRVAVEFWEQHPDAAKRLYDKRIEIERIFSRLTCFGGGLSPLPSWVRRLDRVTLWVTAKIAIYHARLIIRERRTQAA